MSLRLFAAIRPPEELCERIAGVQRGVPGARWRPQDNLHITLRFFGELDEHVAEALDLELARIRATGFDLQLKGAGWFGASEPSTLWLGLAESPQLEKLAADCDKAARRLGLAPDGRKFTAHLTVAYLRGTQPDDCARFVQRLAMFSSEPFLVDRFALYSSHLGKRASDYYAEAEYPLLG